MKSTVGIALLAAMAVVGCNRPASPVQPYDSSATWSALNQAHAEPDFYSGMRKRLEKIDFLCAQKSNTQTECVKHAILAKCTYSETIAFNRLGVSGYTLHKRCGA
jgi:hypothetical protein